MNQDFFSYLPSETTINILSRLPVRTIISCKCVCKSWFDIIETQEFAKSHLSISAPGLAVTEEDGGLSICKIFDFEDALDLEYHELHYNEVTAFQIPDGALVHGSANGLLLLRCFLERPNSLYVCNPITRDYIQLQCPEEFDYRYPQVVTFGFGASVITGQHKVVRIFHDCIRDQETHALVRIPRSECQVYTLGTGSWRSIAPGERFQYNCRTIGVFLNGNLHWLVNDLEGNPLISRFDLDTEAFSTLSRPRLPSRGRVLTGLSVLEGCLCFCDNSSEEEIAIWLMKEYGVEESWTKEFVISRAPDFAGEWYDVVYPIKVFKDGDILMELCESSSYLNYYSTRTKTFHRFITCGIPRSVESILHASSFIPLKSFWMEDVRSF